jgi:catechol 2,3-dioxygenase-like lactoylglutathione lyase family enzyme
VARHSGTIKLASVLLFFGALATMAQTASRSTLKTEPATPVLRNACLITTNVPRLVEFYRQILRVPAKMTGSDYAEFHTGVAVLAIFSADAQEKYIPGSAQAAYNKSTILEFEVADVNQEYTRLQPIVKDWVKSPTTQPWGTTSTYFRDPDGNLINFYAWAKAH